MRAFATYSTDLPVTGKYRAGTLKFRLQPPLSLTKGLE